MDKWCDSWEKNFDSSLKALNKFKDDIKDKPHLSPITERRYALYLDLLEAEIQDLKSRFTVEKIEQTREEFE